jgi:hypothetical protein
VRSAEDAFALRAEMGGTVIHTIARDPVLPPEVWGHRRSVRRLSEAYARADARLAAMARPFLAAVLGSPRGRASVAG